MKHRLETATNIATIAACVAVIGVLAQRWLSGPNTVHPPAYEVGDTISELPEAAFRDSPRTMLLVASEDCRFCQESLPLYNTIASQLVASVRVVLVTSDEPAKADRFIKSSGFREAKIVRLSAARMRSLKIPGTPTVILADSSGVVENIWLGRLNGDRERELISTLSH